MKVTAKWLKKIGACESGRKAFEEKLGKDIEGAELISKLISPSWANWIIVKMMNRKQCLAYAIFAAEQVLDIYEKKYPDNKIPRKAIEAAKAVLANDTSAAWAAWAAAWDAAWAAEAARAAWAAWAAWSAARAAAWAAEAAAGATWDARDAILINILKYGINLLKEAKRG